MPFTRQYRLILSYLRSLDWMESYLLCDPRKPSFRENAVFKKHGNMNSLYNCFHNKNLGGWAHLACYSDMVQACRDRDVILIKTIRFRLDWTRSLLKNYPNLKVLFLVRDPRAVLYSRSKLRAFNNFEITASMSGLDQSAAALCGNMQQNTDAFRRLDHQFPGYHKASFMTFPYYEFSPSSFLVNTFHFHPPKKLEF